MNWNKTFRVGHWVINTLGLIQIYKAGVQAEDIEKYRLAHEASWGPSIKIGRIKAYRALTGASLKDSKFIVELLFDDYGNGEKAL